jgi:hypothetical protein
MGDRNASFGELLRYYRLAVRLTQEELKDPPGRSGQSWTLLRC